MLGGLFKKWDLTRSWPPGHEGTLEVDLDHYRLGGASLKLPMERLRGLGRPDGSFPQYDQDRKHIVGSYYYWRDWGLTVWAEGESITGWDVEIHLDSDSPRPRRFVRGSKPVELTERSTRDDVVSLMGEPTSIDDQGEGATSLCYDPASGAFEVYFDLDAQGHLEELGVDASTVPQPA